MSSGRGGKDSGRGEGDKEGRGGGDDGTGGESGIGINGCAGRWRIENHEWKK